MGNLRVNANNRSYDGDHVQIVMLGNLPRDVSEVTYGYSRPHQHVPGFGADGPTSWGMGKKAFDQGSLTMSMKEQVAIQDAAGGDKDITKIPPFKTVVAYLNDDHKLVYDEVTWKFMNDGRSVQVDDIGLSKQFDMFIVAIRLNIT